MLQPFLTACAAQLQDQQQDDEVQYTCEARNLNLLARKRTRERTHAAITLSVHTHPMPRVRSQQLMFSEEIVLVLINQRGDSKCIVCNVLGVADFY
jgi:hypothetical protein